jgi:threonine-phosphate decarboxylase
MAVTHGGAVFVAARELQCDWREILDFSASINPLGPAPGVRSAIADAVDRVVHYPDPYASNLRAALADEWDVAPERIMVGNGATELIHFLARVWREDATLVTPVFSEFHRAYPLARRIAVGEPWPDRGLVVVTNPLNPTGAAALLPEGRDGMTLVDESFIEFTDLVPCMQRENCIVLRSLTKFHALPGLRVGAVVLPEWLAEELQPRREPWQVNVLAEAAALHALRDRYHQQQTRDYVRFEQQRLARSFVGLAGVRLHPTLANYYLAQLDYSAAALCEHMRGQRILLRNCSGWPGVEGEAVRFAIRTREENDRLIEVWGTFPCD